MTTATPGSEEREEQDSGAAHEREAVSSLPSKGGIDDLLGARRGARGAAANGEPRCPAWQRDPGIGQRVCFADNEDWMNAAAVSFYAILSFIPFLLLMLSVLGFVTHGHTQGSVEQFDQLVARADPRGMPSSRQRWSRSCAAWSRRAAPSG